MRVCALVALLSCASCSSPSQPSRVLTEPTSADGQFHLGSMYERGEGVDQDLEKAAHYYRQAAAQGDVEAAERLALLATALDLK